MRTGLGGQADWTVIVLIRMIFVHIVVFCAPREGLVRQRFDDRQPYFIAQRDKKRHTGMKMLFEFYSFFHRGSSFYNGLKI